MSDETTSTLFGLPTYFIVIAVIAFVIVVAGMTVYMVVLNRIENDAEESGPSPTTFANAPAGTPIQGGWAPPPEPLHGWLVMCAAFMDNGATWLNMPVADAKAMLEGGWGVDSPESLQEVLVGLSQAEPSAWNAVRLFRVALAGVRAGYIGSADAFAGVRPIAQRLQAMTPGFDGVWNGYLDGLRAFKGLPRDGSADDGEIAHYLRKASEIRAASFNGVEYRVSL